MKSTLIPAVLVTLLLSSAQADSKKELWVYTSVYKEFATPLEAAFEKTHPGVDVQIFQAGSEKIQAKVEAEILAKKIQADVLLLSNPFWGESLVKRGLLENSEINYYSLMVLIAHKKVAKDKRPASFNDLTNPRFKNKIQMGSPLESGTFFSSLAYLSKKYGWSYFEALKKNEVASSGGNSSVIQKVESGEKEIGVVLLENALASIKKGSPIEIIYPSDGSIPIPSVQLILKDSKMKEAAKEFTKFVLSKEGQEILRGGYMYSVRKDVATPEGALPYKDATAKSTPWTKASFISIGEEAQKIKEKLSEYLLE